MDDEEIVRNIAGVMIGSLGHEVALAGSFQQRRTKFCFLSSGGSSPGIPVIAADISGN